ncbi:MAG: Crp/Fnr family transcriptional regulator [Candidatus Sumerlaeia bacterium]|nr:Crp/Fnr family transcriptional regulator [Candidatus Sumerlaeia bacterium]
MAKTAGHPHGCDVCAIREGWLFSLLDRRELDLLTQLAHPLTFTRRQILFAEGAEAAQTFLVTHGVVKLLRVSPEGRTQVLRLVYPGHLAGSEGFFRTHHDMSAEGLTPGTACVIPRDRLMRTLRTHPEFALHLLQAMHQELEEARAQILDMGKTTAEAKLCALLCDLLPHLAPVSNGAADFPLAHQDLADVLGLTRETVSRVTAAMAKRRVFTLSRQRLEVHDAARLRSLAR